MCSLGVRIIRVCTAGSLPEQIPKPHPKSLSPLVIELAEVRPFIEGAQQGVPLTVVPASGWVRVHGKEPLARQPILLFDVRVAFEEL